MLPIYFLAYVEYHSVDLYQYLTLFVGPLLFFILIKLLKFNQKSQNKGDFHLLSAILARLDPMNLGTPVEQQLVSRIINVPGLDLS